MSKTLSDIRHERPHHSQSALQQYLNCSLAYYFKYVARTKPEFIPANLAFGGVFHESAGYMLSEGKRTDYKEFFSALWDLKRESDVRFESFGEFVDLREKGMQMLDTLKAGWDGTQEILGVEQPFTAPVPDGEGGYLETPIIGAYDIVVRNGFGETLLVDFKTAARKWAEGKADSEMQATVYCYAWQFDTGETPRFRYDVITKTKTPELVSYYTDRKPGDFLMLTKLVRLVERARAHSVYFPNKTSFFCGGCQFAGACREWCLKSKDFEAAA